MDRINGLYTNLVNGLRMWRNKSVAGGIAGTQFDQVFQNDLQEELIAGIISFAGDVPQAGVQNQLRKNLAVMMAPPPQYIIASQSVTTPVWATRCRYKLWGAGASGNVGTSTTQRGGGGGGGGYADGLATGLTPGQVIPVTIGAGGAAVSSGFGNPGGTTSFGSFASATGGAVAAAITSGGISGAGVGGTRNGGTGDGTDGNLSAGAPGGDGGGAGGRGADGSNAFPGRDWGGGGGGVNSGFSSGAGHDGGAELEFLP